MTHLVDANVLSEPTRPIPDAKVVQWLRENESELVVDPIILGEIQFGIHLLPAGKRRRRFERRVRQGPGELTCLPWTAETGLRWAKLVAALRRAGKARALNDRL